MLRVWLMRCAGAPIRRIAEGPRALPDGSNWSYSASRRGGQLVFMVLALGVAIGIAIAVEYNRSELGSTGTRSEFRFVTLPDRTFEQQVLLLRGANDAAALPLYDDAPSCLTGDSGRLAGIN